MPSLLKNIVAASVFALGVGFAVDATAQQKVLRFIPHSNLPAIDPVATTGYVVRNHGYLVYDTLFATDANFKIQPQMVEKWSASPDGLRWEFKLREGMKFHDDTPVRGADAAASIRRWSARDSFGQTMAGAVAGYDVVDDLTFAIRLTRPFPLMIDALGKLSSQVPFIMPERIANTDPATPIQDATGSGPFRFVRDQWVPGQRAVYERFADYKPRNEPPSWAAGGKVVKGASSRTVRSPPPHWRKAKSIGTSNRCSTCFRSSRAIATSRSPRSIRWVPSRCCDSTICSRRSTI
jgi:peptide/nickel transport system substrate-binding protein